MKRVRITPAGSGTNWLITRNRHWVCPTTTSRSTTAYRFQMSFQWCTMDLQNFGPSIGSIFDQWTFNAKDVLTKVYKSHSLKFGGQYTRLA